MKKIFAFAIAIVAMATSMVSCNNDNADFIEQPAPVVVQQRQAREMMDIDFVVAVTPAQQACFNESYVIEYGGRQYNIAVSDMKPATAKQIEAFSSPQQVADAAGIGQINYYAFNLGKTDVCEGGKILKYIIEVKADHPTGEARFMNDASCFVVNGCVPGDHVCSNASGADMGTDEELNDYAQRMMARYN